VPLEDVLLERLRDNDVVVGGIAIAAGGSLGFALLQLLLHHGGDLLHLLKDALHAWGLGIPASRRKKNRVRSIQLVSIQLGTQSVDDRRGSGCDDRTTFP